MQLAMSGMTEPSVSRVFCIGRGVWCQRDDTVKTNVLVKNDLNCCGQWVTGERCWHMSFHIEHVVEQRTQKCISTFSVGSNVGC